MFQSGFLVQNWKSYSFCHEYYQAAFKMQRLESEDLLSVCLSYYRQLPLKTIRDQYSEIKLKLLACNADLAQLRRDIIALLADSIPKAIEQSLYRLLLQLPPLPEGHDISRCTALFMLCESYIQEEAGKLVRTVWSSCWQHRRMMTKKC